MPRTARKTATSGIYHIMLRGINRQDIFTDDTDRRRFLQLLDDLQHDYDEKGNENTRPCILYAYCLMSNHVHLLYRQGTEEIDQSMKRLEVSYAQYFNKKYGRTGHFFQDRFKSEPCEDFEYFITLLRYIHQNPIKAGITKHAEDYQWSSWREYISTDPCAPTLCNTFVPIKRLQLSGLTLHDLIEMVNVPLPNDCGCLEMDESEIRCQLTDEDVRQLILNISGCETVAQFQRLPFEKMSISILQANRKGAAMKKLARITGISYRQINKIVKRSTTDSRDGLPRFRL